MMQVPKPPHLCFVDNDKDDAKDKDKENDRELIPKELSDVVLKLLAINSYERYPSIDFVIHDLCLILNLVVERERELQAKGKASGDGNDTGNEDGDGDVDVKDHSTNCVDTFKQLSSSTVRLSFPNYMFGRIES
ncbi:unnamed protein product [Ambrosiozyma monospora]|uniref:Unnamed protein product n=1 Tax=Ambrosiozyma monospora TaxID=43982 RepID=A0A9W6WLC1_AMBMO|nr:unnamed protein product [Ambrosiozyma monospora]